MKFRLIHMSTVDTLDLCFQYNIQLIAYSPLGFNAASILLQDTGMPSELHLGCGNPAHHEVRACAQYLLRY